MSVRCQCPHCAASAYTQLLHSAQLDPDVERRQIAWGAMRTIAPLIGAGADQAAQPVLEQLYPVEQSRPLAVVLAGIRVEMETAAQQLVDSITATA